MAGGACWGGVIIPAHDPVFGVQVHLADAGVVGVAMLGFFVDLLLGVVGSQVAF